MRRLSAVPVCGDSRSPAGIGVNACVSQRSIRCPNVSSHSEGMATLLTREALYVWAVTA